MAAMLAKARGRGQVRPFLSAAFYWLIILLLVLLSYCHGGRVDVVKSLMVLKQNQKNETLQVELSEIVILNAVNVTCSQTEFGDRKTRVSFDPLIVPVNSKSGNATIRIISPGEAVRVSCYGVSLNNGGQYRQTNSTGKTGSLMVTKAPTVDVCSSVIFIKGYSRAVQNFDVQLSEPAVKPVIVECFPTDRNQSSSSSLKLEFYRATVPALQSTAKVSFRVLQSGSSVNVACRAQASSCLPVQSTTILIQPSTTAATTTSLLTPSFSLNVTANVTALKTNISSSAVINASKTLISSSLILTSTSSTPLLKTSSSHLNVSSVAANNTTGNASIVARSSIPVAPTATPIPTEAPAPGILDLTSCQYLFNTSTGSPVTLTIEQPSITAYPPSTELQSLYKHVSFLNLDRALDSTSNMDLQCAIRAISIGQIHQTVCNPVSGLPISATGSLVRSEVTLELLESKITFKPGEISKNITIEVKQLGNETFFQLFQAFCCAPVSNLKYEGKAVSVYLWMDSSARVPFTWATIPEKSQRKTTAVESLNFKCPCDLHSRQCDVNCCCDQDCSSSEILRFTCITGAFGGRQTDLFEFSCQATWPEERDWTPALCVVTNNSPFLGYFFKYTSPALTLSLVDYNKMVAGNTVYGYEEAEARSSMQSNVIGYTYGAPIRTDIGFLAMPSPISDSCSFTTINYLKNANSTCLHKATQSACSRATFNALNYLLPTGMTFPACTAPGVLDGKALSTLVQKTVEYYCVKTPSSYVFTDDKQAQLSIAGDALFKGDSTPDVLNRCQFDDSKTRPPEPSYDSGTNTCNNAVFGVDYRMHWNGQQLKSILARITLGSFSAGTVTQLPVTYTYVTTRVITATPSQSISMAPMSTSLGSTPVLVRTAVPSLLSTLVPFASANQSHNSTLIHHTTSTSSSIRSSSTASNTAANSTVVPSTNATNTNITNPSFTESVQFLSTSTNTGVQLSSTQALPVNVSFSKITVSVKTSTVILKKFTILPSVMQKFSVSFTHVKTVGDISSTVSSNMTSLDRSGNPGYGLGKPLVTQTPESITTGNTTTFGLLTWKTSKAGICLESSTTPIQFGKNTISGCLLRFGLDKFSNCSSLIDLVKQSQEKLVKAIKVSKRGNPAVSLSADWLDVVRVPIVEKSVNLTRNGICHNIPSNLLIDVLISEAGMAYGQSQMEISGVRIRYETETWSLKCASGANARCYNNTVANLKLTDPLLKTFAVTSSVSFITIPAVEPAGVKRSIDTSGLCRYDACLKELFYPITDVYSSDVIEFSLGLTQSSTAMAMTLIFIAFGTIFVSRPWRT